MVAMDTCVWMNSSASTILMARLNATWSLNGFFPAEKQEQPFTL
jgi:hypothetical protein